jgi:hypothetical protein
MDSKTKFLDWNVGNKTAYFEFKAKFGKQIREACPNSS